MTVSMHLVEQAEQHVQEHRGLARLATSAAKAERHRQIADAWQRVADARRRRISAMVEAFWAEQA